MVKTKPQYGFAYMALLVVIFASTLALSVALPDKYQQAKRERETQLLFVGQQYANAIKSFYENPYVSVKRYPETLDELLVDNRTAQPRHHLRQLYKDPIRDSSEWGLLTNEEDQIIGVFSLSKDTPLRTNFGLETMVAIASGDKYEDIKFVYLRR